MPELKSRPVNNQQNNQVENKALEELAGTSRRIGRPKAKSFPARLSTSVGFKTREFLEKFIIYFNSSKRVKDNLTPKTSLSEIIRYLINLLQKEIQKLIDEEQDIFNLIASHRRTKFNFAERLDKINLPELPKPLPRTGAYERMIGTVHQQAADMVELLLEKLNMNKRVLTGQVEPVAGAELMRCGIALLQAEIEDCLQSNTDLTEIMINYRKNQVSQSERLEKLMKKIAEL